ncbi:hypothetical protein OAA78_02020 [Flavobacteriaceae bacterium]|nr:hypothetical protein [Flavobacteriaceae bacterium]MDC1492639.1 hypothetical protein [Flavobacteriaceae bacterium]MDC1534850.1 hypothetical protein [Flavobacteriaceae bacterium]
MTILYVFPLKPINKNLRKRPGLKIFIVSIVWSLLIVILPTIDFYDKFNSDLLIYFIQVFIYVFVAILPFDIRDINYDSKKLYTIPQILGLNYTKILGFVLIFIFILLDYIQYLILDSVSLNSILINNIICLVIFSLLYKSNENQSKYFSSFWVESLPIFWLLLNFVL